MDLVTDIKDRKIIWIVILNTLLLLIPLGGGSLIRSGDYKALYLRRIATEELSKSVLDSAKNIPTLSPYQRVMIIDKRELKTTFDTGWQINYPIIAYRNNFKPAGLINNYLGEISKPELNESEIMERLKNYIEDGVSKTGIINYRYIYYISSNDDYSSVIVISDKSDLLRDSVINKILLYTVSVISIIAGVIISFIYYKTGKRLINTTRKLKQEQRALNEFTSDVLHELKNPLTVIRNSAEQHRTRLSEELILKETGRIEKLLFDIKRYALTNSDIAENSVCNPSEIIENLIVIYKVYEIKTELNCFEPVKLSEDKFISVITNIIDNAVSFSKSPSTVEVRFLEGLVLEVSDRGPGIPDNEKDKIFNRFYTNRKDGFKLHSGLGLSIVKKLLDECGATIECQDNKPSGTTFRITFR